MSDGVKGRDAKQLPILGQDGPEGLLPMDRRQALKVMAIAAAAPMPTIETTFSVPARSPPSCGPPVSTGANRARTASVATSAPMP